MGHRKPPEIILQQMSPKDTQMTREEAKNYIKREWKRSDGKRLSLLISRYFKVFKEVGPTINAEPLTSPLEILDGKPL